MIAAHGVELLDPFCIHRTREIYNTVIERFDDRKIVNHRRTNNRCRYVRFHRVLSHKY